MVSKSSYNKPCLNREIQI